MFFLVFATFHCFIRGDCPQKPSEDYLDLSETTEFEANSQLYGCNLLTNNRIDANSCIIKLYSTTFNNVGTGEFDGGVLYIKFASTTTVEGDCLIDNCKFIDCKGKNGGTIYYSSVKASKRNFDIINCTFQHNYAAANGGAIYFSGVFANITNCTFINDNSGGSGCEFYFKNVERTTGTDVMDPLKFKYCLFQGNDDTITNTMFAIDTTAWNKRAYIIIEDCTVKLLFKPQRYFFAHSASFSKTEQNIITSGNFISPSTNYLCPEVNSDIYEMLSAGFEDLPYSPDSSDAPLPEVPEGCPLPPTKYKELSSTNTKGDGSNLYGCQIKFDFPIDSNNCILYIYTCSFNKLISEQNGGSINIFVGPNTPEGSSTIFNCTFSECKGKDGGCIYIQAQESIRFLNITQCKFENNEAIGLGGSIHFYSTYATINECTFINNIAGTKGGDIYFEVYEEEDTEYPFIIENSKFERQTTTSNIGIIYLEWKPSSDFFFNNNEIRIVENSAISLFESNGDITIGNLSCKNNCLIPSNKYLCKDNAKLYNKIRAGFSTSCEPDFNPTTTCPESPNEEYFDLEQGNDNSLTNTTLYGCSIEIKERIESKQNVLFIYSCTFNSLSNPTLQGGAIYISSTSANVLIGGSEIKECIFKGCQASSGGSIYIYTNKANRWINITNCTFENNQASTTGGAIHFKIIHCNVYNCTFKNNHANEKGSEIYYETPETRNTSISPLHIENSLFERTNKELKVELIYLKWTKYCDFVFKYNNIKVPLLSEANRIYSFGAANTDLDKGTIECNNNIISPTTDYLTINPNLYDRIKLGFEDSPDAPLPEVPEGCPLPPTKYKELSSTNTKGDGSNLYGCQIKFDFPIDSNNCILYIYTCSFNKLISEQNGGSINIFVGPNTPEGSSTIFNCTFSECKGKDGGCIYIQAQESIRFLNITQCKFENNEAIGLGGSIHFYSTYATINECTFINNIAGTKGGDIYFEVYEEEDTEYPFIIENSKFERQTTTSNIGIIYLEWKPSSDFFFNNNEIRIVENSAISLFESNGDITIGNLSCKNNCLIPSNKYLCKDNAKLYNKIRAGFSTSCEPDFNPTTTCPESPNEEYFDLEQGNDNSLTNTTLYGCSIEIKERIESKQNVLFIYSCTFNSLSNPTLQGGAIYISSTSANVLIGGSEIKECIFKGCQASSGGSIYIYTNKANRWINITNCTFENNQASTTGGAIHFKIIHCNVYNCTFKNNHANEKGSEIYYETPETRNTSISPLHIENSLFERTNKELKVELIYLKWTKYCDFVFKYNNIKVPLLSEANRIYSFGAANTDLDKGTIECNNNIISPTTDYLTINPNLYDRIKLGFEDSPDAPLPEVPEGCPLPPTKYKELSSTNTKGDGSNLYGCQIKFDFPIDSNNCILYIYTCSFNKLISEQNGGSINIFVGPNTPEGSSTIFNCTFSECKGKDGGCIYIQAQESIRFLNITQCKFENNEAIGLGGSIHFYSTYATINECTFINNIAGTKGGDIYFEVYEEEDTEYPFIIENSKFERQTTTSNIGIIYLEWKPSSDFFFNNNEIRIVENSAISLFESNGDITIGNLSCKNNCLIPSNKYLCKDNNQQLFNRINSGFSDFCNEQLPSEIKDNDTCTMENHCQTIIKEPTYSHVLVTRSEFNKFYHEDNGGAIHMINTGLTCNDATFTECYSVNAGGGGIYIFNELSIPNKYSLTNLNFNSCKAAFGGAIFIYSSNENTPAYINDCIFIKNQVYDNKDKNGLFGGSAVYLTCAGKTKIINCRFRKNRGIGGNCKINNDLNDKPTNNQDVINGLNLLSQNNANVLIFNCSFEIDEDSKSSLYYVNGGKKTTVKNCSFTGILSKNAHFIDGQINKKKILNLNVQSCTFSSDSKGAVNKKFMKIDQKGQIFYNMKLNEKSSFKLWYLIATAGVTCIAVVAALIIKKKNTSIVQEYDISLITEEIENEL